jgi:hypothetical protein
MGTIIMKILNLVKFTLLTIGLQLAACSLASQTSESSIVESAISWSQPTNGLRLGIELSSFRHSSTNHLPACCLYLQNVGSHFVYYRIQSFKKTDVCLIDPTGQQIDWSEKNNDSSAGLQRKGGFDPSDPKQLTQIAFFYVPEKFSITTNGQYQIIASVRCCTNLAGVFGDKPVIFQFPPVTNAFDISVSANEKKSLPHKFKESTIMR